jgi:hypothetical protein
MLTGEGGVAAEDTPEAMAALVLILIPVVGMCAWAGAEAG